MKATKFEFPMDDAPKSLGTKIVQITPIALTVLATILAGVSSSEMTQSMYYRSLAGQHQSKVGDQWAFFQAKRIRGSNAEATATLLHSLGHVESIEPGQLQAEAARVATLLAARASTATAAEQSAAARLDRWLAESARHQAIAYLAGNDLPTVEDQHLPETEEFQNLRQALQMAAHQHTEAELAGVVHDIHPARIEDATRLAEQNADAFGAACDPVGAALKELRAILADLRHATARSAATEAATDTKSANSAKLRDELNGLSASLEAAALDFDGRRYRRESTYHRATAELMELRVARSAEESDLHRQRSRQFFYSMLLAQAGVTIASLALAQTNRSLFWLLAACAGLSALGFSGLTFFSLS